MTSGYSRRSSSLQAKTTNTITDGLGRTGQLWPGIVAGSHACCLGLASVMPLSVTDTRFGAFGALFAEYERFAHRHRDLFPLTCGRGVVGCSFERGFERSEQPASSWGH